MTGLKWSGHVFKQIAFTKMGWLYDLHVSGENYHKDVMYKALREAVDYMEEKTRDWNMIKINIEVISYPDFHCLGESTKNEA